MLFLVFLFRMYECFGDICCNCKVLLLLVILRVIMLRLLVYKIFESGFVLFCFLFVVYIRSFLFDILLSVTVLEINIIVVVRYLLIIVLTRYSFGFCWSRGI